MLKKNILLIAAVAGLVATPIVSMASSAHHTTTQSKLIKSHLSLVPGGNGPYGPHKA